MMNYSIVCIGDGWEKIIGHRNNVDQACDEASRHQALANSSPEPMGWTFEVRNENNKKVNRVADFFDEAGYEAE